MPIQAVTAAPAATASDYGKQAQQETRLAALIMAVPGGCTGEVESATTKPNATTEGLQMQASMTQGWSPLGLPVALGPRPVGSGGSKEVNTIENESSGYG